MVGGDTNLRSSENVLYPGKPQRFRVEWCTGTCTTFQRGNHGWADADAIWEDTDVGRTLTQGRGRGQAPSLQRQVV
jgi:hypothetical protein